MMNVKPWLIALVVLNLNAGCKSTNTTVQADPSSSSPTSDYVFREVPIQDVRYALPIYEPTKAIFANMEGIQYCDSGCRQDKIGLSTGVVAMTAAGSEEGANSLAFAMTNDQHYAFMQGHYPDMQTIPGRSYSAYRLDFSDAKHATLTSGNMVDGHFEEGSQPWERGGQKPSMELVGPHHWVRHTPGRDDYNLYTIVDATGAETEYFQKFADDIKTSGVKKVSIPVSTKTDFGKGGPGPTGPFRDPAGDPSGRDTRDGGSGSDPSRGNDSSGDPANDRRDGSSPRR